MMKTVFLIDNMKFSGGRKTFLEYAVALAKKGHNVEVITPKNKGDLKGIANARKIPSLSPENIPQCDLIVATTPNEVKAAFRSGKGRVVHLCQGFEIEDMEQRIEGKVIPLRYQKTGFFSKLRLLKKKFEWKRKIREYDTIYALDTELLAISPHLKKTLEKRYSRKVFFCGYGVKKDFFYSSSDWKPKNFSRHNPCRIINIGPIDITFKGIPDTLKAVRIAKKMGLPIHFIRVSPDPRREWDCDDGIIDEYYHALSPDKLGNLLRSCDVYISNSLEGEGFGLPAMEALSCGLICILSSISSYLSFNEKHDFACFVPERNPVETANAISRIVSLPPEDIKNYRQKALDVASGYSYEKACDNFEKILMSVVEGNRKN